jgi:hypothetical protein
MKTLSIIAVSVALLTGCGQANAKKETSNETKQVKAEKPVPAKLLQAPTKKFNFENYEAGKLPDDWSQYATGKKLETEWKIVDDEGNKVMAQLSGDNPNYHFNEVVYNGLEAKNVKLKVRIKGVAGHKDQGGGFVWRFKDANNYYVVRENPLEDNVVLYKVEKGVRTDLPLVGKGKTYGMSVPKLGNGWNTLELTVEDDLFTVYLNGKELYKVKDSTFTGKGKVGFWTKADAVSYFDDFEILVTD